MPQDQIAVAPASVSAQQFANFKNANVGNVIPAPQLAPNEALVTQAGSSPVQLNQTPVQQPVVQGQPATPAAPATPATPAATEPPKPADVNPWLDTQEPSIVQSEANLEFLNNFGSLLGMEKPPENFELVLSTVQTLLNRNLLLSNDKEYIDTLSRIDILDVKNGYNDEDLLWLEMKGRLGKDLTDKEIQDKIDGYDEATFSQKVGDIRSSIATEKKALQEKVARIDSDRTAEAKKQADDAAALKKKNDLDFDKALSEYKFHGIKPTTKVLAEIKRSVTSGEFMDNLNNGEWNSFIDAVIITNKKLAAPLVDLLTNKSGDKAVSDFIKDNLINSTPNTGQGEYTTPASNKLTNGAEYIQKSGRTI